MPFYEVKEAIHELDRKIHEYKEQLVVKGGTPVLLNDTELKQLKKMISDIIKKHFITSTDAGFQIEMREVDIMQEFVPGSAGERCHRCHGSGKEP